MIDLAWLPDNVALVTSVTTASLRQILEARVEHSIDRHDALDASEAVELQRAHSVGFGHRLGFP